MSYEELGKSQFEWEKTTDSNTEMSHLLEWFDRDFKAAKMNMCQRAISDVWNKWKNKSQEENRDIKKQMEI